jgi:hypothetical protein
MIDPAVPLVRIVLFNIWGGACFDHGCIYFGEFSHDPHLERIRGAFALRQIDDPCFEDGD